MAAMNPGGAGMPIAETRVAAQDTYDGIVSKDSGSANGTDPEKRGPDVNANPDPGHESDGGSEKQEGVARVEAVTTVWSTKELWITFVLIYLITFVDSLMGSVQGTLSAYVTSAFGRHGLLGTVNIVSTILGGVCNLTIAKIINIWGRMHGLMAMVFLVIIGMIMKATCENVETYAAAQVMYWVGHIGLLYIIDVTLADMTTLKNRMIMFGVCSTPTIATFWAGPRIAELFYWNVNFRWAFGALAIILAGISAPTVAVFLINERRARARGLIKPRNSGRTKWESCKYYFIEFDAVGLFLITAGWSLLLLPFSLATTFPNGWRNPGIIVMFILGPALLALFVLWERYWTTRPFFPWKFLIDRTVLGACLMQGLMFACIYAWNLYYGSVLQVMNYQSISNSSYILNSFSLVSSFISPLIGMLIRYTGNYKWVALGGFPFLVLGTALLVEFRKPSTHVALLVIGQAFNGISSGILALCSQIAIMATVGHNEVAVGLALHSMFGGIGAAVGMAISGAIWTNLLPYRMQHFLPDDAKDQAWALNADLAKQTATTGAIRDAIIQAYADVQQKMVIAGCCFVPFVLASIVVWRNLNVKKIELERGAQSKGNVF